MRAVKIAMKSAEIITVAAEAYMTGNPSKLAKYAAEEALDYAVDKAQEKAVEVAD